MQGCKSKTGGSAEEEDKSFFFIEKSFYTACSNPNGNPLVLGLLEEQNHFLCRGDVPISQELLDLTRTGTDGLHCFLDNISEKEIGSNPLNNNLNIPHAYPPSVFPYLPLNYNQLDREQILELLGNRKKFEVHGMKQTTFAHLNLRLGYPYLFRHHTNCDHIIVVTGIRYVIIYYYY